MLHILSFAFYFALYYEWFFIIIWKSESFYRPCRTQDADTVHDDGKCRRIVNHSGPERADPSQSPQQHSGGVDDNGRRKVLIDDFHRLAANDQGIIQFGRIFRADSNGCWFCCNIRLVKFSLEIPESLMICCLRL